MTILQPASHHNALRRSVARSRFEAVLFLHSELLKILYEARIPYSTVVVSAVWVRAPDSVKIVIGIQNLPIDYSQSSPSRANRTSGSIKLRTWDEKLTAAPFVPANSAKRRRRTVVSSRLPATSTPAIIFRLASRDDLQVPCHASV
jgi:hypothetical protein